MNGRISQKQRDFLEEIDACARPTDDFPEGLPFYASHTHMQFSFNTEGERRRFYANLEARGLVKRHGPAGCFFRLTDAGRAAIGSVLQAAPAEGGAE